MVDISVPYGKEREALGRRSSGEVVQNLLPRARVVKGWNHVFAQYLTAPEVDGIAASVLLAGDDADAKPSSPRWPETWNSTQWTWDRFGRAITWSGW